MGVADARTTGIVNVARYKDNWDFKSLPELKELYTRLLVMFDTQPHGEYLAIQEIFGVAVATRLARDGEVITPGQQRHST